MQVILNPSNQTYLRCSGERFELVVPGIVALEARPEALVLRHAEGRRVGAVLLQVEEGALVRPLPVRRGHPHHQHVGQDLKDMVRG